MPDANANSEGEQAIAVAGRRVLSLALVAGHIDAVGLLDLGGVIHIAAMTGNTVQAAITAIRGQWPHLALLATTLAAFFCGGVVASCVRRRLRHPPGELFIMTVLVLAAQLVRSCLSTPLAIELPLLAVATAMQGQTISRFGGLPIQTIVVTNNLLKLGDAIAGRYLCGSPKAKAGGECIRASQGEVILPACAWVGYALGAGAGALAALHLQLPLVPPALFLIFIACDLLGVRGRVIPIRNSR